MSATPLPDSLPADSSEVQRTLFLSLVSEGKAPVIREGYNTGCAVERRRSTSNFRESKRVMRRLALRRELHTLYCDCPIIQSSGAKGSTLLADETACGYEPARQRAPRLVSWEHIVPASRFGHERECWKGTGCDGRRGRRCCQRIDPCFNLMEGDLHNLAPALAELNEDRSNLPYGEIPGEERRYGRCDFEVSRDVAEPREGIRGDLARSYLYMSWRYGIVLSDRERELMIRWNAADPPDDAERALNEDRAGLQGNENPFVSGWKSPTF